MKAPGISRPRRKPSTVRLEETFPLLADFKNYLPISESTKFKDENIQYSGSHCATHRVHKHGHLSLTTPTESSEGNTMTIQHFCIYTSHLYDLTPFVISTVSSSMNREYLFMAGPMAQFQEDSGFGVDVIGQPTPAVGAGYV